ncbi:MAG: alginate lyase family protein [Anaerolineaceae bacterium]|nr:alginate lyase family protein [Anaerolineaceae bacterium]
MQNSKIKTFYLAIKELGPKPLFHMAVYRIGKKSGYWQSKTPVDAEYNISAENTQIILNNLSSIPIHIPSIKDLEETLSPHPEQRAALLQIADQITRGEVLLFGAVKHVLDFETAESFEHWTAYEKSTYQGKDIKFTWEPARFGWVFTLGQVYLLTGDEKYVETFWRYFEIFQKYHPANRGPNWASAQEVALRLMAFSFALKLFASNSTSTQKRVQNLMMAIAQHAGRILPTISYAKAQNNNHLLTEAAGLFTAGVVLQPLPEAIKWKQNGWKIFQQGISEQIEDDGVYIQQSSNYQRLMLQCAIWMHMLSDDQSFSKEILDKLAASVKWLLAIQDPISGKAANLGHNDGAYIIPLYTSNYSDYRPVLQAASQAFTGLRAYPQGPWDVHALWMDIELGEKQIEVIGPHESILKLSDENSWGVLRSVRHINRPAHADQNHFDLWFQGHNLALDAGSFLYNALPPWENALAKSGVHNTITIDDQDQMLPAGRFLWLRWSQSKILANNTNQISVCHNGYKHLGITHTRTVQHPNDRQWTIKDNVSMRKPIERKIQMHWLLPDFPYTFENDTLNLQAPFGDIQIQIKGENTQEAVQFTLVRCGQIQYGLPAQFPNHGWFSPTYAVKKPALSLIIQTQSSNSISFSTYWKIISK